MIVPAGTHSIRSRAFYLKEFVCLRDEIVWLLKDYRALERNAVIAVGVSWAWLFKEGNTSIRLAWFIPVLFATLGALRASGIFKQFGVFHGYVESVESAFVELGGPQGWEHFSWGKSGWVSQSAFVFWVALLVSTVGIGVYEGVFAARV